MTLTALQITLVSIALVLLFAFTAWWLQPERRLQRKLNATIRAISKEVMRDIVIPDGVDGEIHIEHLLLTARGLLVLDVKHVEGALFGSAQTDTWTAISEGRRVTFANPVAGLQQRVIALKALNEHLPVEGRVVIIGNAELSRDMPAAVRDLAGLRQEFGVAKGADGGLIDAIYPQWDDLRRRAA